MEAICFFIEANFLLLRPYPKKYPNFATHLCLHGNPGNHGNNIKIFSIQLTWPNILTFWQLIWSSHGISVYRGNK